MPKTAATILAYKNDTLIKKFPNNFLFAVDKKNPIFFCILEILG